jgi:hypothetical protein
VISSVAAVYDRRVFAVIPSVVEGSRGESFKIRSSGSLDFAAVGLE